MHNHNNTDPNISVYYRKYHGSNTWRRFGEYCLHCGKRAKRLDLRDDHLKTCRHAQNNLKARTGLVRALEDRQLAYAKNINS